MKEDGGTRCQNHVIQIQDKFYITILAENMVRISDSVQKIRPSYAVQQNFLYQAQEKDIEFDVVEEDGLLKITTAELMIQVDAQCHVDFYKRDGEVLCRDYRGKRLQAAKMSEEEVARMREEGHVVHGSNGTMPYEVVKQLEEGTVFYGLGDKTGYLNKAGYDYEMWNSDNPDPQLETPAFRSLYKSIPFLIAHRMQGSYGIFYDNPNRTYWDLGYENEEYYYFGAGEGGLDYYFFTGSLRDIIAGYTALTGRTPLPQLWTLGYHQSRWSYESEAEVLDLAKNFKANQIPCDAIHFDIDYMEQFKVFTWGKDNFPNPKKLIQKLEKQGIHAVTIIDPGVKKEAGYDVYDTGIEGEYFAKTKEGQVYENVVWPGDSVYPNFCSGKVREWWGDLQGRMIEKGVSGIWNDMNEPASFNGPLPDDVCFSDEYGMLSHKQIHNVYGHLMAQATYEGWKRKEGSRPFVITRACYSGTQRYATAWTGDNHSIWAHLQMSIPQLCNLGMSGMPFVGTDVGGFGSNTTPELLARWVQVGCFSPLFRNHSAKYTKRQEPWLFGEEVLSVYRKYVNLRYQFLPYYYDLFWEHKETGLPIMRPLVLMYEDDEETFQCNDIFMVGDRILVAPVLQQGATHRIVYLPKGGWIDYWSKEYYEGGRYIMVETPLDVCPIFIKDGSIIPVYPYGSLSSTQDIKKDALYLQVWDSKNKKHSVRYQKGIIEEEEPACSDADRCLKGQFVSRYRHYQDNARDFAYEQGEYSSYELCLSEQGEISVRPTWQGYPLYDKISVLTQNK